MISAQNRPLEPLLTMGSEYDYAEKRLLLVGTGGIKRRPVMEALRALGLGRIICLHDERNWAKDFVDDWIDGDPVFPSEETLQMVKNALGNWTPFTPMMTTASSSRRFFPRGSGCQESQRRLHKRQKIRWLCGSCVCKVDYRQCVLLTAPPVIRM